LLVLAWSGTLICQLIHAQLRRLPGFHTHNLDSPILIDSARLYRI
jgi:hypothetical protein